MNLLMIFYLQYIIKIFILKYLTAIIRLIIIFNIDTVMFQYNIIILI